MTAIDTAHAQMQAHPDDDALRLRYYAQLADAELILLLKHKSDGTDITPRVFDLDDGPVVLAFDSEEKLADFVGGIAPYVALPGRVIAQSLAGQGVGVGVNLGAASEMLLDGDAVAWLAQTLQATPVRAEARVETFAAPQVPAGLWQALQDKLRGGAAGRALLTAVNYAGGRRGHMLALLDVDSAAQGALAQAASEALVFSGVEAGEMDVVYLSSTDPVVQAMARVAQAMDLTVAVVQPAAPKPPGMDAERPPRLR